MNLILMSHAVLAILCLGVIIQTIRLSNRLRAVADGRMGKIVFALDRATREARSVLEGLRETLSSDGTALSRNVVAARELADELGVMIGIADAMANRLSEGAGRQDGATGQDEPPAVPAEADTTAARDPETGRLPPINRMFTIRRGTVT